MQISEDMTTFAINGNGVEDIVGTPGDEFLISSNNLGGQDGNTVLSLFDGGFWTAWHSFDPATGDADSAGISLQRFDASGDKVGGEILVNSG